MKENRLPLIRDQVVAKCYYVIGSRILVLKASFRDWWDPPIDYIMDEHLIHIWMSPLKLCTISHLIEVYCNDCRPKKQKEAIKEVCSSLCGAHQPSPCEVRLANQPKI